MATINNANCVMTPYAAGSITEPNQPAFFAFNSTGTSNVTGNSTTPVTVVFDSVAFDQQSNFSSNTFTAPVAGNYIFCVTVNVTGITAAMNNLSLVLVTTNRNYTIGRISPGAAMELATNTFTASGSVLANMSAGHTATVTIAISGGAGATAGVAGDATGKWTSFSGYLGC